MARILSKQVQPTNVLQGAYLNAPEADDGTSKAMLFFASVFVSPSISSRVGLCCWDTNLTGGIHLVFDPEDGNSGIRLQIRDSEGTTSTNNIETIPYGSRYHILISAHVDGVDLIVKAALWSPETRSWSTVIDDTQSTVADTFLNLGSTPLTLLARHTGDSHYFQGGIYRVCMFKSATGSAIADVESSTVQDYFTSGLATKPKSVAVTGIGSTPWFDFGRDPGEYNEGVHSGSLGVFTKVGPILDDPDPDPEDEEEETDTDPPTISGLPVIDGDGEVGVEMTAQPAAATGPGTLTTTWQWLKDGVEISGEETESYTPVSGDVGSSISVVQTTTNEYGSDTATSSAVTAYDAPQAPTISGTPTITGSVVVEETITANAAPVSGATPITTTWQWLTVSGNALTNTATNSTYVLDAADEGEVIYVRQTSTNSAGSDTTDSVSYTIAAAGSDLTVSINVTTPNSNIAPAIYAFEASVSESITRTPASGSYAPYTDLTYLLATYEWTFSSTETGNYSRRARIPVAGHAERSKAIGPQVMYCYTTAATHTVTLRVTFPDGRTGTASTNITITDPTDNAVVPSSNRFLVSPNSSTSGAPDHDPANVYTTLQAAWAAIGSSGLSESDVVEVLLDPAQMHTYSSWQGADSLDMSAITPKQVRIASWTRGTIATIDFPNGGTTAFSADRDGFDIVLKTEDLRLQGPHDMSQETGEVLSGIYNNSGNPTEIVVSNCEFIGASTTASAGNDSAGNVICFNECLWEDFTDFILLWPRATGNVALTGCSYIAEVDGAVGGRGKQDADGNSDELVNRHNFTRVGADLYYCHSCEVKAQHTWSGGLGGGLSVNSPGRLGRNNPADMRCVITNNVLTGSFNNQISKETINPRKSVIERNYCIISPIDNRAFGFQSGLASIKNNIFVRHDTPLRAGARKWTAPCAGGTNKYSDVETENEPVFVMGNTLVDYSTNDNFEEDFGMFDTGGLLHVEEENNVIHRPNLDVPVTADVDTTALGFDSWCGNLRFNWCLVEGLTGSSTVAPAGTFTVPYSATTTYLEDTWTENYQLGQADFSAINESWPRERHKTAFWYEISAGVGISVDTPEVGQVTVTNNTGYNWGVGCQVRLRFQPIGESSPQIVKTLDADVLDGGGTVVFDNPNGYTLDVGGGHVRVNIPGNEFSISAESGGLQFTNDSDVTDWPSGMSVNFIVDTKSNPPPDLTVFAHPSGSLSLFRPNAAIAAGSDDQLKPLTDFEGQPRIGSNHPNATGGTYTAGAIDP